jgi:hydroxyethylthiazole kinase-like uncharacterized protein yjeF
MLPSTRLQPALNPDNLTHANWQQPGHDTLPVLSVKQVRALEHAAFAQTDSFLLMQAAGLRTALKIVDQIAHSEPHTLRCVVLAGPGNNGGDACIVAGELKRHGLDVALYQVTEEKTGSKDRMQAVLWALAHGVQPVEIQDSAQLPDISPNTLVVDGLLGIACNRAPEGLIRMLIRHVNDRVKQINSQMRHKQVRVIALDCPSGVNCDTGDAPGEAISAHTTFSYLACKHGLLTGQGKTLAGDLWIDDLNCGELLNALRNEQHTELVTELGTELVTEPLIEPQGLTSNQPDFGKSILALSRAEQLQRLPRRGHEHHKGSFGSIAVLGGQQGMVGACVLSARTALQLGCGRVALSLLGEADAHLPDVQQQGQTLFLDLVFPEIMNKGLESNLEFADIATIGPGLGQSEEAIQMLHAVLEHDKGLHMVWDADALNLLANNASLRARFLHYRSKHPTRSLVLTPHPLEAARLLQSTTEMVQADRLGAAQAISERFNCTVVLKGAGSLICNGQNMEINITGGPALGTAGSGDVLAGAIAALLGQGLSEFDAAAFGVYLHGFAIEPTHGEQHGLLISHASEIALRMKNSLNSLLNQVARHHSQLP